MVKLSPVKSENRGPATVMNRGKKAVLVMTGRKMEKVRYKREKDGREQNRHGHQRHDH